MLNARGFSEFDTRSVFCHAVFILCPGSFLLVALSRISHLSLPRFSSEIVVALPLESYAFFLEALFLQFGRAHSKEKQQLVRDEIALLDFHI